MENSYKFRSSIVGRIITGILLLVFIGKWIVYLYYKSLDKNDHLNTENLINNLTGFIFLILGTGMYFFHREYDWKYIFGFRKSGKKVTANMFNSSLVFVTFGWVLLNLTNAQLRHSSSK